VMLLPMQATLTGDGYFPGSTGCENTELQRDIAKINTRRRFIS